MATEITAEAIQLMIQDALAAQAVVHRNELATQAARFQQASSTQRHSSPIPVAPQACQ